MRSLVIYHRSDFDGIFCREIAKRFVPDADFVGWDYGDAVPSVENGQRLYILDLSIPELMEHPGLIWIDHHKSAIERYPAILPGYRIDGVAACRLAWQWFRLYADWDQRELYPPYDLPSKAAFESREVHEPYAVRLAGEYDIWDKRDPNAELFQHGLRSQDLNEDDWRSLLNWPEEDGGKLTMRLLNQGRALQFAKTAENTSIITHQGFDLSFEGLRFIACNHARFNSFLFTAALKPEHDACLGFCWDGQKQQWKVSLYHAPGKEHYDLSKIAVKHGGGGHRGACGFTCKSLPFSL